MPLLLHATATRPGAIAILQLIGDSRDVVRQLTSIDDWPIGTLRLVDFEGIDEGLAVRLTADVTELMPHGGPRVIQRLTARLLELGAELADPAALDPQLMYPEASDRFEALALHAVSRAHSPLGIDLLLDQPRRWREFVASGARLSDEDRARSQRLNRLIDPPIVVLAGRPNVGKSTLSNALLGRAMSISSDLPGTTRDYTAGRIDLAGLVVDWHDTPGIRQTDDPIERRAIELSRRLIQRADLLIAMADPDSDWPDLPRDPDLRVMNKSDLLEVAGPSGHVLHIIATTGHNLAALVALVRDRLVLPYDLTHSGPWLFDDRLLGHISGPGLRVTTC